MLSRAWKVGHNIITAQVLHLSMVSRRRPTISEDPNLKRFFLSIKQPR